MFGDSNSRPNGSSEQELGAAVKNEIGIVRLKRSTCVRIGVL